MVTIKDISRRCGVSPATVSKALNGYDDIGAETAERIRRTAREMHYMPNAAARLLKTNFSHNIGVVFEDETQSGLTHEYFSHILNSAKNEAEADGYDITFISSKIGGRSFLEHCRYRKCDGVLIASVDFSNPQVIELVNSEFPTVTIDYSFDNRSSVMSDNVNGTYQLVRYLYSMGHRRIAFIHGEETSVTLKRLNGFYKACRELDLKVPNEYIIKGAFHEPKDSGEAAEKLMSLPVKPTAIMFPDDYSYLGGMAALEKMGYSVPDDVSVTGYDGIELSQVVRPRLATWHQDADRIGKAAAEKLIETIEHRRSSEAVQIMVTGQLIEGDSVRKI